jgi:hypothetical protein
MKLTKEECLKEIHNLERYIGREFECSQVMRECENSLDVLEQLINEYFDNPEITSISAYRILKYKIDELEKALDKACDYLTYLSNQTEEVMFEEGITNTDKEFWKEYLLNDIS